MHTVPERRNGLGLEAWEKQGAPQGNWRETNVSARGEEKGSREVQSSSAQEKAASIAQAGKCWPAGGVGGGGVKTAREGNTMANASFSKRAWAVSCCSGPRKLTHMQTQGKNPHGTLPETWERGWEGGGGKQKEIQCSALLCSHEIFNTTPVVRRQTASTWWAYMKHKKKKSYGRRMSQKSRSRFASAAGFPRCPWLIPHKSQTLCPLPVDIYVRDKAPSSIYHHQRTNRYGTETENMRTTDQKSERERVKNPPPLHPPPI